MIMMIGLLWNALAFASGNGVGNGGDVLFCPNTPKSYEFFDLYEAKELFNQNPASCEGKSPEHCLHSLISPLLLKFPSTARSLLDRVDSFQKEALFKRNVNLVDIGDSESLFLPTGCELLQLAIQVTNNSLPPGYRYLVNADYWDRLSNEGKAAAMLHEILQTERESGDGSTATKLRRVVLGYVSGAALQMSEKSFFEFYASNSKTWISISRAGLSWLLQNDSFDGYGHVHLTWNADRLVKVENTLLPIVGVISKGELELIHKGGWYGSDRQVEIEVSEESFKFLKPKSMTLQKRGKEIGEFIQISHIDSEKICAREFRRADGNHPNNFINKDCWQWNELSISSHPHQ